VKERVELYLYTPPPGLHDLIYGEPFIKNVKVEITLQQAMKAEFE